MPPAVRRRRKDGRWQSCTASVCALAAAGPGTSTLRHARSYAPRTSYAFCKDHLDTLCKNLKGQRRPASPTPTPRPDDCAGPDRTAQGQRAGRTALGLNHRGAEARPGSAFGSVGRHQGRPRQRLCGKKGRSPSPCSNSSTEVHNAAGIGTRWTSSRLPGGVSAPENAQGHQRHCQSGGRGGLGIEGRVGQGRGGAGRSTRLGILGEDTKSLSASLQGQRGDDHAGGSARLQAARQPQGAGRGR